jgi:hypothetical protein
MLRFVKAEASRLGFQFDSPDEAFLTGGGDALVKAHTRGLVAVLDSMQRHGYVEPDAT